MSTITVGELARRLRDAATAWAPALRAELRLGGEDATARYAASPQSASPRGPGGSSGRSGRVRDLTLSVHGAQASPQSSGGGATIRARSPGGMRFRACAAGDARTRCGSGRRFVADAGREAGDRLAGRISPDSPLCWRVPMA